MYRAVLTPRSGAAVDLALPGSDLEKAPWLLVLKYGHRVPRCWFQHLLERQGASLMACRISVL